MSNSGVSQIYTGASDFGKFTASIGGIIGTLIGIIIIGIGIYFIVESSRRTQVKTGEVVESTCAFEPLVIETQTTSSPTTTGSLGIDPPPLSPPFALTGTSGDGLCEITLRWDGNKGQKCKEQFTVENEAKFGIGANVPIWFDPKEPCNTASLESQSQLSRYGTIVIVIGVVILLIVWLSVYLVYRFKFLAAAEGVGTVIDIAESL